MYMLSSVTGMRCCIICYMCITSYRVGCRPVCCSMGMVYRMLGIVRALYARAYHKSFRTNGSKRGYGAFTCVKWLNIFGSCTIHSTNIWYFYEKSGVKKKIRLNMFSILYFVCFLGLNCVQGDGGDMSEWRISLWRRVTVYCCSRASREKFNSIVLRLEISLYWLWRTYLHTKSGKITTLTTFEIVDNAQLQHSNR